MKKCDNKNKTPLTIKQIKPLQKKTNQTPILLKKTFGETHWKNKKYGKKNTFWRKYLLEKNFWKTTLIFNRNPHFEENPPT